MEKEQFIKAFIEKEFSFLSEERKITIYAIYTIGKYDGQQQIEKENEKQ